MSLVVVSNTASWVGARWPSRSETIRSTRCRCRFAGPCFEGRDLYPADAAAAILILFGLAALAPAVSSLAKYSEGIGAHWPGSAPEPGNLDCLSACFCVDGQLSGRSPGPDLPSQWASSLHRSWARWPATCWEGIRFDSRCRTGINPAGLLAWAAGCSVAAALELTTRSSTGRDRLAAARIDLRLHRVGVRLLGCSHAWDWGLPPVLVRAPVRTIRRPGSLGQGSEHGSSRARGLACLKGQADPRPAAPCERPLAPRGLLPSGEIVAVSHQVQIVERVSHGLACACCIVPEPEQSVRKGNDRITYFAELILMIRLS